jgi:hypothetical protein
MNLTTLKKLAEAATVFCNKCGYIGKSEPTHIRTPIGTEMPTQCQYQGLRMVYVHNADILAMIEVMEQMGEELHILHGVFPSNALAAYRKLKEG